MKNSLSRKSNVELTLSTLPKKIITHRDPDPANTLVFSAGKPYLRAPG
jgi:hypothetical protein